MNRFLVLVLVCGAAGRPQVQDPVPPQEPEPLIDPSSHQVPENQSQLQQGQVQQPLAKNSANYRQQSDSIEPQQSPADLNSVQNPANLIQNLQQQSDGSAPQPPPEDPSLQQRTGIKGSQQQQSGLIQPPPATLDSNPQPQSDGSAPLLLSVDPSSQQQAAQHVTDQIIQQPADPSEIPTPAADPNLPQQIEISEPEQEADRIQQQPLTRIPPNSQQQLEGSGSPQSPVISSSQSQVNITGLRQPQQISEQSFPFHQNLEGSGLKQPSVDPSLTEHSEILESKQTNKTLDLQSVVDPTQQSAVEENSQLQSEISGPGKPQQARDLSQQHRPLASDLSLQSQEPNTQLSDTIKIITSENSIPSLHNQSLDQLVNLNPPFNDVEMPREPQLLDKSSQQQPQIDVEQRNPVTWGPLEAQDTLNPDIVTWESDEVLDLEAATWGPLEPQEQLNSESVNRGSSDSQKEQNQTPVIQESRDYLERPSNLTREPGNSQEGLGEAVQESTNIMESGTTQEFGNIKDKPEPIPANGGAVEQEDQSKQLLAKQDRPLQYPNEDLEPTNDKSQQNGQGGAQSWEQQFQQEAMQQADKYGTPHIPIEPDNPQSQLDQDDQLTSQEIDQ